MPFVMKTYVLIFFFMICHVNLCFSQNLLSEDKLWSNAIIGTENIDIYRSSYWIKFQGDTTLNNVQYKKILQANDSLHSDWFLSGFIREDDVAQKVYLFNNYTKSDVLLYDFSLEKGDSILMWDGLTSAKIDTILYEPFGDSKDSLKQICFYKGCTHKWIKGIGSSLGVLNGLNALKTVGAYNYLVCYYENEKLIYSNPLFNDCYITTGISPFHKTPELVKVISAPNGILVLELTSSVSGTIFIFNMLGEIVSQKKILDSTSQLYVPGTGIYLYRFVSDDGQIQTGKTFIH